MRTNLMEAALKIAAVTVLAVATIMIVGCPGGPPPGSPPPLNPLTLLPTDPNTSASNSCAVTNLPTWFHSKAVTLNGVVDPADSVNFANTPNCSFYQWAMQDFLWLTSPAPPSYGGGGGLIIDSPTFFDVSPPDASGNRTLLRHSAGFIRPFALRAAQVGPQGLQLIFDASGSPLQVKPAEKGAKLIVLDASGQKVQVVHARMGENRKPILLEKEGKVIHTRPPAVAKRDDRAAANNLVTAQKFIIDGLPIFIDPSLAVIDVEQGQASFGGNGAVLEAQASAGGSLVYFATIVNDVYAYYATAVADHAPPLASDSICTSLPGVPCFPTTQQQLNQISTFASGHTTFPDANALAIEVKSAWVVAAGLPNLSSYITMNATIPVYNPAAPPPPGTTTMTATGGQQTVKLALVGMHVVGSVKGHPEMIWATFEHVANAPADTYQYINTAGSTVPVNQSVSTLPVISGTSTPWVFCTTTASPPPTFNHQNMSFSSPNIIANPPSTISPSNTIRWKAFGAASDTIPSPLDASVAVSNTQVISANNSINSTISGISGLASGDVRGNYVMTGATWTIGGASPSGFAGGPGSNQVGTSALANTTMETYQQGADNTLAHGGTNCFSCHSGRTNTAGATNTNTTAVSHVFINQANGTLGLKPLF
jgi:hypothetical protein